MEKITHQCGMIVREYELFTPGASRSFLALEASRFSSKDFEAFVSSAHLLPDYQTAVAGVFSDKGLSPALAVAA